MTDFHTNFAATPTPKSVLSRAVAFSEKLIIPLSLFSAFLFLFLSLSWNVLVPHITHTNLLGMSVPTEDVLPRKQTLEAKVKSLEERRKDRVFGSDPLHAFIDDVRTHQEKGWSILVRTTSLAAAQDIPGSVSITETLLDTTAGTLKVTGDVHGVGPRSMTVLAGFVDSVGKIDSVTNVQTSAFTRDVLPDGSFHSPFTITIHFRAS